MKIARFKDYFDKNELLAEVSPEKRQLTTSNLTNIVADIIADGVKTIEMTKKEFKVLVQYLISKEPSELPVTWRGELCKGEFLKIWGVKIIIAKEA